MYDELLKSWSGNTEQYLEPSKKMAELALTNAEKAFAMQMNLAQGYFDLAMKQMKAMLEVKDPASLQAFLSQQAEVAKSVSEKVVADAQAVAELNAEAGAEVKKLAEESIKTATAGPRKGRKVA